MIVNPARYTLDEARTYLMGLMEALDDGSDIAEVLGQVGGGKAEYKVVGDRDFIFWNDRVADRYEVYYRKDEKRGEVDGALCVEDLPGTHAFITALIGSDEDSVFWWMQGENWSPNGEARPIIEQAGVAHTSMMIGDVLRDPEGRYWQCGHSGEWRKLPCRDVQLRRVIVDRSGVREERLNETQLRQENEDTPYFAEAVLEAVMAGRAYNDTDPDGRWPLVFYVPGEDAR